jgi:hypothetical protein
VCLLLSDADDILPVNESNNYRAPREENQTGIVENAFHFWLTGDWLVFFCKKQELVAERICLLAIHSFIYSFIAFFDATLAHFW